MAKADKKTTRKAKVKVDRTGETKADKFRRLGKPRLEAAMTKIRLIGNLAGPGYEYSAEQIEVIKGHLTTTVNDTLAKFQPKSAAAKVEITL